MPVPLLLDLPPLLPRVYTEICAASLASHDAADRLRANLQREHNVNMEFVVFVFKGVLDLVQVGRRDARGLGKAAQLT